MHNFVTKSIAHVVSGSSTYNHQFGNSCEYRGTLPCGGSQPLHLLYRFDCSDPLVPVRIPHVRYLPLFYGFVYDASDVAYRVVSEDKIEILSLERNKVVRDFPYSNYPNAFPATPVSLLPVSYEEHKTLITYLAFDGEIGGAEEVLSQSDKDFIRQSGYPFTQLGGYHRLWQDIQLRYCPNSECEGNKSGFFMKVFAVI